MLDDDELMYTRILNHNATPNEITDYIDKLHKTIRLMAEQLSTPVNSKEFIINYYKEKVNERRRKESY